MLYFFIWNFGLFFTAFLSNIIIVNILDSFLFMFIFDQVGGSTLKTSETIVQEYQELTFFKIELRDSLQPGKTSSVSLL